MASVCVFVLYTGCAAPEEHSAATLGSGSRVESSGDWNDIDAAVLVGVSRVEMAIVEIVEESPNRRLFRLTTAREEPARLTVTREQTSAEAVRVTLEAVVGRFGDEARERGLMAAVGERLMALKGVDYAPIAGE